MCDRDFLTAKGMKRIGNLYRKIISLENLYLADQKASKGKGYQAAVREHKASWERNLYSLYHALETKQFRTSQYTIFKVYEPKEREVYRLPYYPDRIVHHAIMNILEPIFVGIFTRDTYSCIKGKGIHGVAAGIKNALQDGSGTKYCLKLDIRKFYPSISHNVLKGLLRRKFKDEDLLWLLEEIIDSAPGLPIGNYLSQYFANFYLTYFDHWLKEQLRVRHYFRYADDLVILAPDKPSLHTLLAEIREYLAIKLRLQLKGNYQVFPVAVRGIDVVVYVFYHSHTRLRKTIKKNFIRMLFNRPNLASIASYYGWVKHCNGNHLLKKLLHEQVQRLQRAGRSQSLRRRQGQDRPNSQPGDHRQGLPDRALGFQRKRKRAQVKSRFQPRFGTTYPFHELLYPDGNDQKGAGKPVSLHSDHC